MATYKLPTWVGCAAIKAKLTTHSLFWPTKELHCSATRQSTQPPKLPTLPPPQFVLYTVVT
jgi:hypothetical protein